MGAPRRLTFAPLWRVGSRAISRASAGASSSLVAIEAMVAEKPKEEPPMLGDVVGAWRAGIGVTGEVGHSRAS